MNSKFALLFACIILFAVKSYGQDEVNTEIISPDDYSNYLETVTDSVQYLKDVWSTALSNIHDDNHNYLELKKNTTQILKFIRDKKHDIKNLGAIGKKAENLKTSYVQYLTAEMEFINKYYKPFDNASDATFALLNDNFKQASEVEKELQEKLSIAKEAFENANSLDADDGKE